MSNQKEPISKHCILLLNFGEHEAEVLRKAGFNVEVGYFADRVSDDSGKKSLPYYFPRPVYEYEVLVYNSKAPDEKSVSGLFPRIGNLLADQKMMAPLLVWNTLPDVRIAFTGYAGAKSLFPAGLGFLELTEAHAGVSIFEIAEPGQTFAIRELAKVIASFRSKIAEPVRQYSHWAERQRQWPFSHFPVIVNRNGDQIASYGTTYDSRTIPRYVVLPQLNNNSTALAELLGLIARLHPELFPDRELREWYTADEFAFQEEKNIDQELEEKIQDIRALIARRQQEKVEVAERYGFIKKILVAKEDPAVETDDRLSTNVRKVLEFLGFQVEDIDAKIRGVIRKEDFWVRDGDFCHHRSHGHSW